jgi:succinate dehydrogenase flavin-adding protein (antitoxin of CptAB toxin-antitoxin module)
MTVTANIIKEYGRLVERAIKIVGGPPYYQYVHEEQFAKIEVDGDDAVLSWPHANLEYDCVVTDTEKQAFPADLLDISDADLDAWIWEQKAAYDAKQEERQRAEMRERQMQERAVYEALKAKYGGA